MPSQIGYPALTEDDASSGNKSWTTPANAEVCDGVYATCDTGLGSGTPQDLTDQLVIAGTLSGNNMAVGAWTGGVDVVMTYGSPTSLPGVSLTPDQVNASDFGFGLQAVLSTAISHFIKATQFGFSIPDNAQIYGVVISVKAHFNAGASVVLAVDCITMEIFYNLLARIISIGSMADVGDFQF